MTKEEAMKLALKRVANWNEHPATLAIDSGSNGVRDFYRNIAQEALAEQPAQQEPVEFKFVVIDNHHPDGITFEQWVKPAQQCVACEGKPSQENNPCAVCGKPAQQEPVAWMHVMDNTEGIKANGTGVTSYTQKQKHPFGKPGIDFSKSYPITSTPLYTSPPAQRKPLTDEHRAMIQRGVDRTTPPFNPDWNTEAVLVEEMQRMAKRIEKLEATLERQTTRIVDLQTHIANLEGEE